MDSTSSVRRPRSRSPAGAGGVSLALFMQHGMNPWLAALLGILLGCAMGLINAVLVQFIAIPAIVATLATLSVYRGLAQALSGGEQVTGLPSGNSFFTFLGAASRAAYFKDEVRKQLDNQDQYLGPMPTGG